MKLVNMKFMEPLLQLELKQTVCGDMLQTQMQLAAEIKHNLCCMDLYFINDLLISNSI